MTRNIPAVLMLLFLAAVSSIADQIIPPQNYGPPYLYPDSASRRLYKLPFIKGRAFATMDGYGSEYNGSHHPDYSVDFAMPDSEPICAMRAGRVYMIYPYDNVCNLPTSQGNRVIITHADSMPDSSVVGGWRKVNVRDMYLHVNHNIPVKPGQWVEQGQVVAYSSCTGQDGGGPHLHFKAWVDSVAGVWRHMGWFDFDTTYKFASIPTPFVEVTTHANGLTEEGDFFQSQNEQPVEAENGVQATAATALQLRISPNPFTPRTVFSFNLDHPAETMLEVFTTAGQRVFRMENSIRCAGIQAVAWDAGHLPGGVYLATLTAGTRKMSVKALLMR